MNKILAAVAAIALAGCAALATLQVLPDKPSKPEAPRYEKAAAAVFANVAKKDWEAACRYIDPTFWLGKGVDPTMCAEALKAEFGEVKDFTYRVLTSAKANSNQAVVVLQIRGSDTAWITLSLGMELNRNNFNTINCQGAPEPCVGYDDWGKLPAGPEQGPMRWRLIVAA